MNDTPLQRLMEGEIDSRWYIDLRKEKPPTRNFIMNETDYLQKLYDCANEACKERLQAPGHYQLNCLEARKVITNFEDECYEVVIEEADPLDYELQGFILDYMNNRGYDVNVITEW